MPSLTPTGHIYMAQDPSSRSFSRTSNKFYTADLSIHDPLQSGRYSLQPFFDQLNFVGLELQSASDPTPEAIHGVDVP
jgi:hypothetical protein